MKAVGMGSRCQQMKSIVAVTCRVVLALLHRLDHLCLKLIGIHERTLGNRLYCQVLTEAVDSENRSNLSFDVALLNLLDNSWSLTSTILEGQPELVHV